MRASPTLRNQLNLVTSFERCRKQLPLWKAKIEILINFP